MARRVQTKADERLASLVASRYIAAADARSARESAWNDARKRVDPQYVDKSKVKRGPYVKAGYVFRNVQTKTAHLLAASEANGRWVVARSSTPEHGPVGEVVTQALERQFRRNSADLFSNNERVLEMYARSGILYGRSDAHICWYDNGVDWGCRLKHLDPFDVFPDWKHNRWIIIRRWVTLAELYDIASEVSAPSGEVVATDPMTGDPIIDEEPADGGRALKAVKQIEKELRSGKRGPNIDREYYAETANQRQHTLGRVDDFDDGYEQYERVEDDPFNQRLMLLEYFETRSDGIQARVIPGFGKDAMDLVLQSEPLPYGICPIVPFIPVPIDNEVWGYGESEIVGHLSEVMDANLRAFMRVIQRKADEPLLVRRGLKLRREVLQDPSGRAIEVDDPGADMGYLASSSDGSLHNLGAMVSRQWADMITGESEARRGQVGGADSATEAAIAEQGGQSNDTLLFRNWRRSIEQIGRVMLAIMKRRLTRETAIPVLGKNSERFLSLRPEYLKGDFEIVFGGSTRGVNPRQEVAELQAFAAAFGPAGVVDLNAVARKILYKIGESDPDALLVQKSAKPSMSPDMENGAILDFNMDIEVSPADNHQQHVQKHAMAFQRVGSVDPMHPRLGALQQHLQFHLMAMQQMAGQMQAVPGPASGPGEPMVNTSSTENMRDERQRPNQDAGGQSPGGVVPGRQVGQVVSGGMVR